MNTTDIRLQRLEPIRVASAYGFGADPEEQAWQTLVQWAKPKGLLDDLEAHPIFGFNNPYPTAEHPRYGYEFWIKVPPDVEPDNGIRIGEFFGGLYALLRCEARGHPEVNIPAGWKALADWCTNNRHAMGSHLALEKFLSSPGDAENLVLDLCCPILS